MKRSLLKRISASLAACVLITASAGGCGSKDLILYDPEDGSSRERISVTFFGYKADAINLTAIENAMQSFMAENSDVIITYEGIKGPVYWDAFDRRDEANVLDDVVMMHHDHVISMSAEGKLADLSDLSGIENYTAEAKDQFINPDGTIYFLPTQVSTYNLYINYDILKKHGQKVPENWEEFSNCCDYFVSKGIVPIIANNLNSLPTLMISKALFNVYQQHDVEAELEKFNNDPALLAETLSSGVEQTAGMLERGWFDPAEVLVTEQTSDDLKLFLKGDRPFMISGGWASIRVTAEKPDFSFGIHPYPILDDGCVLSAQMDTCISVNANSRSLDTAKKFVNYLIQPDIMWAYCDSQASYTPLKDNRVPSEKTLSPSAGYLMNGRVVLRNEYRMDLPIQSALQSCANTLLNGGTADEAQAALTEVLLG